VQHAAVAEVGVIGVPHPVKGELVCACVALRPGATVTAEALVA
jgi:acyl-coenzyme A synthetase/AMP-(fatty) acid ligase